MGGHPLKPVIVIPTFCKGKRSRPTADVLTAYDHMTPLSQRGELPRCLASLRDTHVDVPIVVVVVSEKGSEADAESKVCSIAAEFPELDLRVVGQQALMCLRERAEQVGAGAVLEGVDLAGYGKMRNLSLVLALAAGFDVVIFLDDDEVVEKPGFVERACYGLGHLSPSGIPILAKTGWSRNGDGSVGFPHDSHWYDHFWPTEEVFNDWLRRSLQGSRLSRSTAAFGGCLALHKEAFRRIAFDPYISRGEDTDYLINMRLYGSEIWFDNQWYVRHLPPEGEEVSRFRQDIYRWLYEFRKLEFAKVQIDLYPVTPRSLMPYPGPFLEAGIQRRIILTALLRTIGVRGKARGYFGTAMEARKGASAYAEQHCHSYFDFQYLWPEGCGLLAQDPLVRGLLDA